MVKTTPIVDRSDRDYPLRIWCTCFSAKLAAWAHAVAPPPELEENRGGVGRRRKGKQRSEYDYDEEN